MVARFHVVLFLREYTLVCFTDRYGCHFEVLDGRGDIHGDDRIFATPEAAEWEGREWIRAHS